MATDSKVLEIDAKNVALCLQQVRMDLDGSGGDPVLDFSSVQRLDPQALRELEELLALAEDKTVQVEMRGVNVEIYKVLKLVKLASRIRFLA